ncbi:hypothetical protein AQUCO_06100075v1 [Aquilegia coerulea]|uniref:F-box domain-containing protein n=1 Tax=Aquilegia coerulea TaxID=218851 RepID=A0A2G5CDG9_AQUCA|nr:hypothetical protein AQUCO_06100075v1 [Aquilegia coerulea]
MDCLPTEITTQILSRLPIQSVFRCRSVCKPWKKIIDFHQFTQLHFTKSFQQEEETSFGKKNPFTFIFIPKDCHAVYFVEQGPKNPYIFKSTRITFLSRPPSVIMSYKNLFTNGLLCLPSNEPINEECFTYVCNPVTQDCIMLPKFITTSHVKSLHLPAFGFDHSNKVFKVVQLFYLLDSDGMKYEAQVFTLGTNSWRKLENVPKMKCCLNSTAAVNGSVHWFTECEYTERKIMSFNLASEKFGYIELPESCRSREGKFRLTNLNGWLSLFNVNRDDHIGVWVMKDYNVQASWTKFVMRRNNEMMFMDIVPISFWKNGEILLLGGIIDLFSYNFDTKEYTYFRVDGLPMSDYDINIHEHLDSCWKFLRATPPYFMSSKILTLELPHTCSIPAT